MLVTLDEEDFSFNWWDNCWNSFSTAETQGGSEILIEFSSWLASLTTVGAFVSLQLIAARLLVYDVGGLHAGFHHISHVHGISHGLLDTWLSYTSTTVNSLKYWISSSSGGHLALGICKSFLDGISVHTQWKLPPKTSDSCPFYNYFVSDLIPNKGSQLLGFLTL